MKSTFTLFLSIMFALTMSAQIRVISNTSLGKGYYPRFADETTLTCFADESAAYDQMATDDALRVDNKGISLLYGTGEPSGVEQIALQPAVSAKVYRDGQLYIVRNGVWYNLLGTIIKQ